MRQAINSFCARIGADPLLVQGAGGNVSWKSEGVLWVKASGTWLSDALSQDIFVPVELNGLQDKLRAGDFNTPIQAMATSALRPSIETLLHALMPQKVVVHVHAIEVLAHLVRKHVDTSLPRSWPADTATLTIPYQKPGAPLAQAVAEGLTAQPGTRVVFLRNHGLVLAGDTLEEVEALLNGLTRRLASPEQPMPATTTQNTHIPAPLQSLDGAVRLTSLPIASIHQLAQDPTLCRRLEQDWALYPDHVVFLGAEPICHADASSALLAQQGSAIPRDQAQFVAGLGVFSVDPLSEARLAQLRCYRDVMARQSPDTALLSLDSQQVAELLGWDAEKHRQHLSR